MTIHNDNRKFLSAELADALEKWESERDKLLADLKERNLVTEKTNFSELITSKPVQQSLLHPRRCETCDHFDASKDEEGFGRCVANHPVAFPTGMSASGRLAMVSIFPRVSPTDRCGKWHEIEARPAQTP